MLFNQILNKLLYELLELTLHYCYYDAFTLFWWCMYICIIYQIVYLYFIHVELYFHSIFIFQQFRQVRQSPRPTPPSSVGSTPSKSFLSASPGLSPQQSNQQNIPQNQFLPLQQKQRSFLTFGFGAGAGGSGGPSRRESHVNVNVTPTSHDIGSDTPEIRKYKKRFNSEILCAALWGKFSNSNVLLYSIYEIDDYLICLLTGVNLLIGTENGLMLLDRSGQGKVYHLIYRRRFQQMEVLEGQNILVTVSGKKNRVRVYYLSWLKSKILRTDGLSDVSIYFM